MRADLAAGRLHRRLSPEPAETRSDDADAQETALSKWLPTASPDDGPGWLAAIRADPGRAGLFALGAVGVIAVIVPVFAMMHDKPPAIASAKLPPVQMVSSAAPSPGRASPYGNRRPTGRCQRGRVGPQTGTGHAATGARIADAVAAVGGTLDGVDLIGLNMAQRVADGEQIMVGIAPVPGEPTKLGSGVTPSTGASTAPTTSGSPSGTAAGRSVSTSRPSNNWTRLPGIGPVTAAAIVAWRDKNGKFTSVDQLGDVDGIGSARLEKLRTLVRV